MRSAQVTRCTESSVPVDACVCDTYQVEMIVPVGNYCLAILCVLRSPGDIKMLTILASWLLGRFSRVATLGTIWIMFRRYSVLAIL